MSRTSALVVSLAFSGSAVAGCTGTAQRQTDPPAAAATKDDSILIEGPLLSSLTVAPAGERQADAGLSLAGRVQFDEDRVARIIAPIAGQIVGLRVKVGDRVQSGEAMCAINSREAATAVADYIESRTDLDLAEKQAAITRDLFEHEAASRIAMQQAENDLGKAQARVARKIEELNVLGLAAERDIKRFNGRLPILAPISGVIVDRKVTDGQFVQSDPTPIVTIANLDRVWVMGDLFERDLRFVLPNQTATITTSAYPEDSFTGRVDYISESIDATTRTAKVRVAVANPGGKLKPEMFVNVGLQVSSGAATLVVPASAVFTELGRNYVYVEIASGRFRKRAIDIQQDHGSDRRVLGGLQRGERIVTDGVLLLQQEEKQRAG